MSAVPPRSSWDELDADPTRVGVYGFARSYAEHRTDGTAVVPPYFFRGRLTDVAVGDEPVVTALADGRLLAEELELVLLVSRERAGAPFAVTGYTFGNDLTDLTEFREDAARIQWAKAPRAALAAGFWPAPAAPESVEVVVERLSADGAATTYRAALGHAHVVLPPDRIPEVVGRFAGADGFDHVLLYTGAPRGLAWREEPPRGLRAGDRLSLAVTGHGVVLRTRVEPKRATTSRGAE